MRNFIFGVSLILNIVFIALGFLAIQRYGGWRHLWAKINNRGVEKTYEHRKNMFQQMPVASSDVVIFLGNSITAQNEWAEMFGTPTILNRGIPGDHCDGIRARLEEILRHRPSKIFLMVGVNDLAFYPPHKVIPKYERLLDEILLKAPYTRLYLQSVLPVNNLVCPTPVDNDDIQILNQGIEALAREKRLTFINLYPLLLDANGNLDAAYTLDGIHLNGLAYRIWKNAIDHLLPDSGKSG